jgi:hypothetical protein
VYIYIMAAYIPPVENLSQFDTVVFKSTDIITLGEASQLFQSSKRYAYGEFTYNDFNTPIVITTTAGQITKPTYTNSYNTFNCLIHPTESSRIVVKLTGVYRIAVSPNVTSNGANSLDFWLMINGANIEATNSQLTTKNGKDLPFVEYIEYLKADDYIEFGFFATGNISLNAVAPVTTGTVRPLTPAVIVTLNLVN